MSTQPVASTPIPARSSINFPPSFDREIYRLNNPDLMRLTGPQLERHYQQFGRSEGRACSTVVDRHSFVASVPDDFRILELGPLASPMIQSTQVDYFDRLNTEELRRIAELNGFDSSRVPEIRWVEANADLSIVTEKYDIVISSHVIEHQFDLVGHLKQVEGLLEPGGMYLLVVPDKRYCFDHFIAESTIADVLQAHFSELRSHELCSVIEHYALTTHNDPLRHWRGDSPRRRPTAEAVREAIRHFQESGTNLDVHKWSFTPESFEEILQLLNELEYSAFTLERIYPTIRGTFEFFAVLSTAS